MTAEPAEPAVTAEPALAAAPALTAEHLSRRFRGVTAVADVSLRVPAGARFGIIGPNGAGKTTLFNLLSGELRPSAGQVALFGRDMTRLRPLPPGGARAGPDVPGHPGVQRPHRAGEPDPGPARAEPVQAVA